MKKDLKKSYSKSVLHKRKKRRKVKKMIALTVFMIGVLVTVCLKASFFDIKNIKIINNKIVSEEEIKNSIELQDGSNIFYFNNKLLIYSIKKNPYIREAKISRKLPSTLVISVEEREAFFYGKKENDYYIFDNEGKVLDIRKSIESFNLIEVKGINFEGVNTGDKIKVSNERAFDFIKEFSNLININESSVKFSSLDITNFLDIKVYSSNMELRIGREDEVKDKLNKAINILEQKKELQQAKGYIDVSFKGNPVVHIN